MPKTIFDGVHGYTSWGETELAIIDTPEFQRLRDIKQLGACSYVFPTACHRRFEHSLGVGYLAERFSTRLMHEQPELELTSKNVLLFKIAGLCHDLGHGPLSHGFDSLLTHDRRARRGEAGEALDEHEARSVQMFRYIVDVRKVPLSATDVDIVCELIVPQKMDLPPYWYQIIANVLDQIDVDKFDYLKRDCQMVGLSTNIDVERFFKYARVIEGRICYPIKMQFDIHDLFALRARLHAQVYQHPVVRGVEWMHIDYLVATRDAWWGQVHDPARFCSLTDLLFTSLYLESVREGLGDDCYARAAELLRRIACREVYRFAGELKLRHGETIADVAARAGAPALPSELADDGRSFRELATAEDHLYRHKSPLIFDCVQIGYATNPISGVRFYDRTAAAETARVLDITTRSTLCAGNSHCDVYLRVYARHECHAAAAKEWTSNLVQWYNTPTPQTLDSSSA